MDAIGLEIAILGRIYPTGIFTGAWNFNRATFQNNGIIYAIKTDQYIDSPVKCQIIINKEGKIYVNEA